MIWLKTSNFLFKKYGLHLHFAPSMFLSFFSMILGCMILRYEHGEIENKGQF